MKKFISMVMAAAMVVSLVPATAFAANTASAKVVGAEEWDKTFAASNRDLNAGNTDAQLQIAIEDIDTVASVNNSFDLELEFEGAEFDANISRNTAVTASVVRTQQDGSGTVISTNVVVDRLVEFEDQEISLVITESGVDFKKGDVLIIPMATLGLQLTSNSEGHTATVAVVGGDFGTSDALTFVTVLGQALDIDVAGKNVEVAQEEVEKLKTITIKSKVNNFRAGDDIKVKASKGFELTTGALALNVEDGLGNPVSFTWDDETLVLDGDDAAADDEIIITNLYIEAVSAKPGDVATLTVSCKDYDKASDEAAVVVEDAVILEVDEDEDVPVFYSGVDVANTGLNDDEDHESLTVTIKESCLDAWDTVGAWSLSLTEGVYVADVEVTPTGIASWTSKQRADVHLDGSAYNTAEAVFAYAYDKGDYETFEFGRRTLDVNASAKAEIDVTFTLVAEPGFEGDVVLTLEGDDMDDKKEVVIAKFVAPYTVEAAQNDLIIDYRNTVVPTDVKVTEAEVGLWSENDGDGLAQFGFWMDHITFEDDATVAVTEDSGMEIDDDVTFVYATGDSFDMGFKVDEEGDDEAAVVTLSDIELYMSRSLPAGAYDLELYTTMASALGGQAIFGAGDVYADVYESAMGHVVKEAWVNIITAGRDQDDASFTKKVVVPVGEMYIVAGEETVTLDVPAYVSAEGYTMLPVRAVAVALGINTENVLWNQASKQVTILYGQRIITMTVGSKVITVNGSSIPASASVEIVNGRTFLPMRDLATALGVTDITWDQATKTATLNGNQK